MTATKAEELREEFEKETQKWAVVAKSKTGYTDYSEAYVHWLEARCLALIQERDKATAKLEEAKRKVEELTVKLNIISLVS